MTSGFLNSIQWAKQRGHTAKLRKHHCRLDLRQRVFSERVVSRWNRLDRQETIDSTSANIFKNNLSRLRDSQMRLFMDEYSARPRGRTSEWSSIASLVRPHQVSYQVRQIGPNYSSSSSSIDSKNNYNASVITVTILIHTITGLSPHG